MTTIKRRKICKKLIELWGLKSQVKLTLAAIGQKRDRTLAAEMLEVLIDRMLLTFTPDVLSAMEEFYFSPCGRKMQEQYNKLMYGYVVSILDEVIERRKVEIK